MDIRPGGDVQDAKDAKSGSASVLAVPSADKGTFSHEILDTLAALKPSSHKLKLLAYVQDGAEITARADTTVTLDCSGKNPYLAPQKRLYDQELSEREWAPTAPELRQWNDVAWDVAIDWLTAQDAKAAAQLQTLAVTREYKQDDFRYLDVVYAMKYAKDKGPPGLCYLVDGTLRQEYSRTDHDYSGPWNVGMTDPGMDIRCGVLAKDKTFAHKRGR